MELPNAGPESDRRPPATPVPTEPPAQPPKRFRIEKIEERIAPKKHKSYSSVNESGGVSVY